MPGLELEAFKVVPYLQLRSDGRDINLASFWDGTEWHGWVPAPNGLIKIQGGEVIEGGYFAARPERETDVMFDFTDFLWKHASYPYLTRWIYAVETEFFRIATSLAKIGHLDHFLDGRPDNQRNAYSGFVSTEVEYLFWRCRSLFDTLQQIVAALWERVTLSSPEAQRRKKNLPAESFRSALERLDKWDTSKGPPYGLPDSLLDAYRRSRPFFFSLRAVRDGLTHAGGKVSTIFMTETGNAVAKDSKLAAMTPQLRGDDAYNANLVSLKPVLSNLIFSTLTTLNEFIDALRAVVRFPESMVPNHSYFLRGIHMGAFADAYKIHHRAPSVTSDPLSERRADPAT